MQLLNIIRMPVALWGLKGLVLASQSIDNSTNLVIEKTVEAIKDDSVLHTTTDGLPDKINNEINSDTIDNIEIESTNNQIESNADFVPTKDIPISIDINIKKDESQDNDSKLIENKTLPEMVKEEENISNDHMRRLSPFGMYYDGNMSMGYGYPGLYSGFGSYGYGGWPHQTAATYGIYGSSYPNMYDSYYSAMPLANQSSMYGQYFGSPGMIGYPRSQAVGYNYRYPYSRRIYETPADKLGGGGKYRRMQSREIKEINDDINLGEIDTLHDNDNDNRIIDSSATDTQLPFGIPIDTAFEQIASSDAKLNQDSEKNDLILTNDLNTVNEENGAINDGEINKDPLSIPASINNNEVGMETVDATAILPSTDEVELGVIADDTNIPLNFSDNIKETADETAAPNHIDKNNLTETSSFDAGMDASGKGDEIKIIFSTLSEIQLVAISNRIKSILVEASDAEKWEEDCKGLVEFMNVTGGLWYCVAGESFGGFFQWREAGFFSLVSQDGFVKKTLFIWTI